jgi:hypothetical protein
MNEKIVITIEYRPKVEEYEHDLEWALDIIFKQLREGCVFGPDESDIGEYGYCRQKLPVD